MSSARKYTNKLQGSRVLVIGGSSGIGFGVAEAALEHGAFVTISSSSQSKLDNAVARLQEHAKAVGLNPDVISAKTCDLGKPETMEQNIIELFESATKDGKLDHVVFTAGDALAVRPLAETTVESVNATGNVRYVGGVMVAKHVPKYVNNSIKSSYTTTGGTITWRPRPNWGVIAAAGGAIEAMSRAFAIDLKPIRVNCVQLGAVKTELFSSIPEDALPGVLKGMAADAITNTVGTPEEVAEAYVYLMKDSFATASVLETTGGRLYGDSKEGSDW